MTILSLPAFPFTPKQSLYAARFWSRVNITADPDECWEWQGGRNEHNYGKMYFDGQVYSTHRLSWYLANRIQPDEAVLHKCDNPPCVNPNHLRSGTQIDNMLDVVAKGRQHKGSEKPLAKLTEDQVIDARHRYANYSASIDELATENQVSESVMYYAVTGRSWKHVAVPDGVTTRAAQGNKGIYQRSCKLTVEDVVRIKTLLRDGMQPTPIARLIGKVTAGTVSNIKHGHHWKSVKIEALEDNDE